MTDSNKQEPNQVFQQTPQQAAPSSRNQIPVEVVNLPSNGLLYPPDHPFSNDSEVEIRCMTAREEDILTSRALIKNGTVISKLLQSCLMNKMVDPDELLLGDRNALMIAIRVSGYGPGYSAKVSCTNCGEEQDHEFNMGELEVKPLGANPVRENTNLFEFRLPLSSQLVQFKLLTGKDDAELSKIAERKKKLKQQIENSVTEKLIYSIVSINGETDTQKIVSAVNNMRAGDALALRSYMNKIEPDINMKQKFDCSACNETVEVTIPLGISFFWPDIS